LDSKNLKEFQQNKNNLMREDLITELVAWKQMASIKIETGKLKAKMLK